MDQKINLTRYVAEIRKNMGIGISEEIIEKDLLLTLILGEFEMRGPGKGLIFKGGTLLSRHYLEYHRFSEDLDFVYRGSNELRKLKRGLREKKIKQFMDSFVPQLYSVAESLGLAFSANRSDTKFC